jgi:hypothetical protein
MRSETFAIEQHLIQTIEKWPDELSENAELAGERSDSESACRAGRLARLPHSPFRSAGGYLNYAGWVDCGRFMELDRAIRLQTNKTQSTEDESGSDNCCPESYPEHLNQSAQLSKGLARSTPREKHWTALSFADLLIVLEGQPLRRL